MAIQVFFATLFDCYRHWVGSLCFRWHLRCFALFLAALYICKKVSIFSVFWFGKSLGTARIPLTWRAAVIQVMHFVHFPFQIKFRSGVALGSVNLFSRADHIFPCPIMVAGLLVCEIIFSGNGFTALGFHVLCAK